MHGDSGKMPSPSQWNSISGEVQKFLGTLAKCAVPLPRPPNGTACLFRRRSDVSLHTQQYSAIRGSAIWGTISLMVCRWQCWTRYVDGRNLGLSEICKHNDGFSGLVESMMFSLSLWKSPHPHSLGYFPLQTVTVAQKQCEFGGMVWGE